MKQFKRDNNQNSNKLNLDQYYTSDISAQHCIDKTKEILGNLVTEIIEPSAGNGSFSGKLRKCIAYDLEPRAEGIIKQDFLKLDIPYKKGRLFIGNPPYGSRNNLAKAFCNKAFELGDFVAFILPISQLNNTQSIYKFDLIYSEDLGKQDYSGRKIHCCFNIYKRPENGFNKISKFKDSSILEIRESIKNKNPKRNRIVSGFDYDIAIGTWGEGGIGKVIKYEGQYVKEFYIKIKDEKRKSFILDLIRNAKWKEIYPYSASPNLLKWQVYQYVEKELKKY